MKKKGASFSIPEPCHEGWENMKPVEKGRYCSSCAKTVVDFSVMTDFQILDFMNKSAGSVCGRMSSTQMNRVMYQPQVVQSGYFSLRALVLGTALSTFTAFDASAQVKMGKVAARPEVVGINHRGEILATPGESAFPKVSGFIVSQSGDSLGNLSIGVYTESEVLIGVHRTSPNGYFEISWNDPKFQPDYLLIALAGYVSQTIKVSDMKPNATIILVEEPPAMIEGMIIRD